jgi:prolyl oligopeptidase PreP (S9A serine peptidase family)
MDYGTAQDSQAMFNTSKAILGTQCQAGIQYPATMVTTGDHDDRVAHSFKFAAELQENKQEITLHSVSMSKGQRSKISFGYHSGKRGYSSLHTVQYGI